MNYSEILEIKNDATKEEMRNIIYYLKNITLIKIMVKMNI